MSNNFGAGAYALAEANRARSDGYNQGYNAAKREYEAIMDNKHDEADLAIYCEKVKGAVNTAEERGRAEFYMSQLEKALEVIKNIDPNHPVLKDIDKQFDNTKFNFIDEVKHVFFHPNLLKESWINGIIPQRIRDKITINDNGFSVVRHETKKEINDKLLEKEAQKQAKIDKHKEDVEKRGGSLGYFLRGRPD